MPCDPELEDYVSDGFGSLSLVDRQEIVTIALSPETYQVFGGRMTEWDSLSDFVFEWADHDPEDAFETWLPLLTHPYGRRGALDAVDTAIRHRPRLAQRAMVALTEHRAALQDLDAEETGSLGDLLALLRPDFAESFRTDGGGNSAGPTE
ncbi:hypothetical protein EON79_13625 [bacterium]|nr:MAG: hypothetical protein EON79_13625 [bacterium]